MIEFLNEHRGNYDLECGINDGGAWTHCGIDRETFTYRKWLDKEDGELVDVLWEAVKECL